MIDQLSFSGGCQCGAVRYKIAGPLDRASICHCRMCQKAFGNIGAPLVAVPLSAFTWTRGQPGAFRSSVVVERGFCRDCGTPLYMLEDGWQLMEVAIGSLDDPNAIGPMRHQVGVESRVRWFASLFTLPEKTTEEDRTPEDLAKLKSLQHPDRED